MLTDKLKTLIREAKDLMKIKPIDKSNILAANNKILESIDLLNSGKPVCLLTCDTSLNETKTLIWRDQTGNGNDATISQLDFVSGNYAGTGWTERGLQLNNESLLDMDYVSGKTIIISFNTLNWALRNIIAVIKLMTDDGNEYVMNFLHWGYIASYIYKDDETTEVQSQSLSDNNIFTDYSDEYHQLALTFNGNVIRSYVDGVFAKQVTVSKIGNITKLKMYNSSTRNTKAPYDKVEIYRSVLDDDYIRVINNRYVKSKEVDYGPVSTQTEFETVASMRLANLQPGASVYTLGYYTTNDDGAAKYQIMTAEEFNNTLPSDLKLIETASGVDAMNKGDDYGNIVLKNGNVAKLVIENNTTSAAQWGAKGDGITSDTEAMICLLANVKSGTINFTKDATYIIASRTKDEQSHFSDNRFRKNMMGNFTGGLQHPLISNTENVILNGNGCTWKIPDDDFGSYSMGMLNLGGIVKNVEITGFTFDSNGLTMTDKNKTSNHTICYTPGSLDIDNSEISNINIHHNIFKANGTIVNTQDGGGDHILIINPTKSENVFIEDNEFYDWGRWVFSVDLGGSGERFYNYKFNRNKCIQTDENVLPTGKYRGLGWIDFEARKCWTGLEVKGNYVRGLAGFAMNGNGKTLMDVTLSDNDIATINRSYRSAYPYFINWYSVRDVKNFVCENNTFNTGYSIVPSRYAVDGCIYRNNHSLEKGDMLFLHGLFGDIIIDNNIRDDGGEILMIDQELYLPSYLTETDEKHCNFVFTNNTGGIKSNTNKSAFFYNPSKPGEYSFINITVKDNKMNSCGITTFDSPYEIDPDQLIKGKDGGYVFRGAHFTGQTFTHPINNPVCCAPMYKSGELVVENVNMSRMEIAYYYTSQIEKGKTYNIYCTEDGYFPLAYQDKYLPVESGKNTSLHEYYYNNENLYVITKAGTLGTIDEINSINHTSGTVTCGTAELTFVCKLAKFRADEVIV